MSRNHYLIFETAAGFCGIVWSDAGIVRFRLPSSTTEAATRLLLRDLRDAEPGTPPPAIAKTVAAAKRYFDGERTDFSAVTLDLSEQDEFFRRIYAELRKVGWGQTTTYGSLAKQIGGGPETARDVGVAMGSNPVPLIIPCHRVLAAGGKLGGFSAPGGAASKERMLKLEGVTIEPDKPKAKSKPKAESAQRAFGF